MTLFFRLLDVPVEQKGRALKEIIRQAGAQVSTVERDASAFSEIPGSPLAYWVSDNLRQIFRSLEPFEAADRSVRQGLATADDFRFVRTWWEVDEQQIGIRWFTFAKGGNFLPFYADLPLVLLWESSGAILKAKVIAEYGNAGKRIYNEEFYFRAGITWPLRAHRFAPQALPVGCICSVRGYSAFTAYEMLLPTLAIFNSSAFDFLFKTFLGRFGYPEFIVGILQRMPWAQMSPSLQNTMSSLARRAWSLKRSQDTTNETSHAFLLPSGLNEKETGLDPVAHERELAQIQQHIDEQVFRLYGIDPSDRAVIAASSQRGSLSDVSTDDSCEDEDTGESETIDSVPSDTLFSWLVGVAFGRFDPRLVSPVVQSYKMSGGEPNTPLARQRPIPPEPEPFDPLPTRSPGMWPDDESPVIVPPDIMVDDAGHDHDIRLQVAEAAAVTGCPNSHDLRQWLAHEFFPLHIKMYSKSRRKAPIYWQLATPSASYSVWLYIHAFTKDTLFRVQNDYVAPKLAHEERRLEEMTREVHEKGTAAQRKELSLQENFVAELRAFLDEVKRVAPLWNPNLDDGVIINFAPLWRLVPQHKAWQKELKSAWDALCAGKYDWANLAMHLWPERVVPKCATDRSFAIAHGLEDVFWVEGSDAKWTARKNPTRPLDELVQERTVPAVKAALKSLLDAPQPAVSGRKAKRG